MMNILAIILLLPLAGVLLNFLFGWRRGEKFAGWVSVAVMALAFAASVAGFVQLLGLPPTERLLRVDLFKWIAIGKFEVNAGLMLDPLSSLMTLVVTGVGTLIHIYSIGYMHGDRSVVRYFIYLNLFVFFMLTLVLGSNLLVLFVGWEGVGLCSYLLIGFWFERPAASEAGKKAFIVNRIGDFCFLIALFMIVGIFGTLDFAAILQSAPGKLTVGGSAVTAICLLLFAGATGKSAQIPLFVWLPDAMEGPTPVSALIHAATMVTAGVYLMARMYFLFDLAPVATNIIAIIGAATLLLAATIATVQTDIKRVLAYSTVSQLGYMVMAVGVGAYSAAIFHLMTHAFFKALLFMGAGSVIHALKGEQNMNRMGGLSAALPATSLTCTVAGFAIAGIFPLAGFFSKDAILFSAMTSERGGLGFWLAGATGALLTTFYIFRLLFKTFYGRCNLTMEEQRNLHESPASMTFPLKVLAVLSFVGGWVGIPLIPGVNIFDGFLAPVFGAAGETHHEVLFELAMMAVSFAIAILGIFLAHNLFVLNVKGSAGYVERFPGLYRLLFNKYYIDEIYDSLVVQPIRRVSVRLWRDFDDGMLDASVNGVGGFVILAGDVVRKLQTGYVKSYAVMMLVGVFAILLYLTTGVK